jgi:hypothetical protein
MAINLIVSKGLTKFIYMYSQKINISVYIVYMSVWLAQSVEWPPTALTTQWDPGSIPGADGLTQPSIPSG